ncbi:non-ribosomal peptide synthetase [Burkholderia stabilis]|uniref:non-ribosomal peptide synthetase n=1 Tax=Burkholderia stabilis TaxID=95485 RepID=UPI001589F269|nr:non-ribosomal peptide synthetase [Burkholderia stabilis]
MATEFLSKERQQLARNLLERRGLAAGRYQAISRRADDGPAPLSFAQLRLWYHEQLHPGSALYNTPIAVEFQGKLDTRALERAIEHVIERHEILRTVFRMVDGEPRQVVQAPRGVQLPIEDLTSFPVEDRERIATISAERAVREPINLSDGPVFHARLIKLDEQRWWLLVLNHHMVFDGWSRTVLVKELAAWYATILGQGAPLPPLSIQYGDFASWQRSKEVEAKLDEQLTWWKRTLEGAPTFLSLPTDRPRPPVQSFRGNTTVFTIDAATHAQIGAFARETGVSTFVVLAAALKLLLYRLTGQADLIVSTGIATRQQKQIEDLIGCFINVLLLRTNFSDSPSCIDLVRRVSDTTMNAFAHQDLPFDRLVTALAPERDLSYNPLAQVMIVHHNEDRDEGEFPGLRMQRIMPEKLIAQYDLLLHLRPIDEELFGMLEYNVDLFDERSVQRMCEQYVHVLGEIIANPHVSIEDVTVLPQHQVEAILALNEAPAQFPHDRCIHGLIEARAGEQPDAPAIETAGSVISYGDLNRDANKLARHMRRLGVRRGDVVGVSLERTPEMAIALLAIVKCGAAYVPIDPNYPLERVRYIVSDSKTRLVVTQSGFLEKLGDQIDGVTLLSLDHETDRIADYPDGNLDLEVSSDDLLYLIYTSGSTGAPKGVMLDHRGRVNNFHDFNTRFQVGPGDRVLAVSSPSFDMCAYDVFGTLMAGGTIVMPSGGALPQPDEWGALIRSHGVTIWHSAPALLGALLERFERGAIDAAPRLRLALLGGDWIPLTVPDDLRRYAGPDVVVVSLGGATEVSMDSTIHVVGERDPNWSSIPYGVAMANQTAYVLDDRMRVAPIGVAGDLYLGGVGVGWGYFHRAELSATRFVPNRYSRVPGERIYRTGDIARWTNAGTLELLGRADFQVKINGVRMELGEIDAALVALDGVKACVTSLHRPTDAPPRLVSYIVTEGEGFDWERARNALFERLPSYMVPRHHVLLERLPLSPNGKVLRTALPPPAIDTSAEVALTGPRTVMERTLHTLWASALGHEEFGIDHDFFDLGGTSLQAALIVNRLPRRLSLVEFMRHSTVRTQAAVLSNDDRPAESRIFRFPANGVSRLTLLCVPYAGGSAIVFRGLARALPSGVATAVVTMPPPADCENPAVTLEAIAGQCLDELSTQELSNIALYGHCAGTALAAELARQLERRGHKVRGLFLAAAMPPGIPSPFTQPRETEEEIVEFVAALGGTEESSNVDDWKVMVREFQRDSRLVREHFKRILAQPREPLAAPLTVLMGDNDPLTEGHQDHEQVWQRVSGRIAIHTVEGGHYFVSTASGRVADIVAGSLE